MQLMAKLEGSASPQAQTQTAPETAEALPGTTASNLNAPRCDPAECRAVTDNALNARIQALEAQNAAERTTRLRNEITALANEGRLPLNAVENWLPLAVANETAIMTQLRAMPLNLPGGEPVNAVVELTSEDPREVSKAVENLWGGSTIHNAEVARERGIRRAGIIAKNMAKLIPYVSNTNTVSTDLKRTVILQQAIRAFAIRILPLSAFAVTFNGVRLQGTDKVAVPYFPLITTASTAFVAGTGYTTFVNSNSDAKTVTVDKRQYLGLTWTSAELARQPLMDLVMATQLIADQLGLDVVNDFLSIILQATYGASVKAEPAAAFDSDDVIDLKGVADVANWPAMGRSLILNSAYDVNLLKDQAIKNAMAFGDNSPIREGRIQRIAGFDYYPDAASQPTTKTSRA
jgi:hypothetical protein